MSAMKGCVYANHYLLSACNSENIFLISNTMWNGCFIVGRISLYLIHYIFFLNTKFLDDSRSTLCNWINCIPSFMNMNYEYILIMLILMVFASIDAFRSCVSWLRLFIIEHRPIYGQSIPYTRTYTWNIKYNCSRGKRIICCCFQYVLIKWYFSVVPLRCGELEEWARMHNILYSFSIWIWKQ